MKQCFEPNCKLKIEYECKCTSPETYSCKLHWIKHRNLLKRTHNFVHVFIKPVKDTKKAILKLLSEEKIKQENIKRRVLISFSKNILELERNFENLLKKLDFDSCNINHCFDRISQVKRLSKFEQDPILKLLILEPKEAAQKFTEIVPEAHNLYSNDKWHCKSKEIDYISIEQQIKDEFEISQKRFSNILSIYEEYYPNCIQLKKIKDTISNLITEIEKSKIEIEDWRESQLKLLNPKLQSTNENLNKILLSAKEKQPFVENSHLEINQISTSLYLIDEINNSTKLFIYDTKTEVEKVISLNTPEMLDRGTCTALLPENQLFCYGKALPASGISLIIDRSYGFRVLPFGIPCCYSSAIYFNNNVYLFGGQNNDCNSLSLSEKFDLIRNQWIKLKPMPQTDSYCHCILFNDDILISGYKSRNILRYSIEYDSFLEIPFRFSEWTRKILISGERVYLIEWGTDGLIYESENRNELIWKKIASTKIITDFSSQIYCIVNDGIIFIGSRFADGYYKFSLKEKAMMKLDQKVFN